MKAHNNEEGSKRIITKYGNRRLYDTSESAYIAFADLKKLIYGNISFCIVDAKTKLDVTRSVLVQVIAEDKKFSNDALSIELMKRLIQLYDNPMKDLYGKYLEGILTTLATRYESVIGWNARGNGVSIENTLNVSEININFHEFLIEYNHHISGFLTDIQKRLSEK